MPPITDRRKVLLEASVLAPLPGGVFALALDNGHKLTGYVSKKSYLSKKDILQDQRIVIEVPSFDLSHGQILRHAIPSTTAATLSACGHLSSHDAIAKTDNQSLTCISQN